MDRTENKPYLSVVIPTYNRKDRLRVTLDALARQSYPTEHYEVVVVSDGSTDGTDAFLAQYGAQLCYTLRAVTQANSGPSSARNRGVREARGEVIVFLDDDVEPIPDFLAAHAAHHRADERVAVIGPMSPDPLLQRRRAEPVWIAWEHAMLAKQYAAWKSGLWKGAGPHHFYTGNASLRREHIVAVGGFDETFKRQEDVELAHRMARERGVCFVFDAGAAGIHRPVRSWESWLRVPYAYGQLDVVRARRGDVSWDLVRHAYRTRSRLTRLLADFLFVCPGATRPLGELLGAGVHTCYRLGLVGPALGGLSVLYNLRYLEAVRAELGTGRDLRRLLK